MPTFKFSKLVRDKIVDNQLASGAKPTYRQLDKDEHKQQLLVKLIEESQEIKHADAQEVVDELADVQQIIDDLRDLYGVSAPDLRAAQERKNHKNGAFQQGIYIESVEVDESSPWSKYYRQHPDCYPEL